jgi:hypothetical protein
LEAKHTKYGSSDRVRQVNRARSCVVYVRPSLGFCCRDSGRLVVKFASKLGLDRTLPLPWCPYYVIASVAEVRFAKSPTVIAHAICELYQSVLCVILCHVLRARIVHECSCVGKTKVEEKKNKKNISCKIFMPFYCQKRKKLNSIEGCEKRIFCEIFLS